jgi:hypothetical protein
MKRKRASARNPALALQGTPAGFGLSDRSAACPEPLGDLKRAPRALFIHCDTTDSEMQSQRRTIDCETLGWGTGA